MNAKTVTLSRLQSGDESMPAVGGDLGQVYAGFAAILVE